MAGDNVEIVESFTFLGIDIHNTGSSERDIRKRIAIARNCVAFPDRNMALYLLSAHKLTTRSSLHPSGHSLWSRNMVPYSTTREESGCLVVPAAYIKPWFHVKIKFQGMHGTTSETK